MISFFYLFELHIFPSPTYNALLLELLQGSVPLRVLWGYSAAAKHNTVRNYIILESAI